MKTSRNIGISDKLIVSFHIGKGGRFNNAGHRTFIGEKNFQDLLSIENNNLFFRDRDKKGRFCKPFITDCSGNPVTSDDINGLTGALDFDGQYDTSYAVKIEDCTESELAIIAESHDYKSPKLTAHLTAINPLLTFDDYGILQVNETTETTEEG